MELAGRALSEAHPAGRDQIHLDPHQGTPVQVFEHRPGHLDNLALRLMTCNARGSRVPAIVRWMAARPTQSSEPGAEPITDTDVYESGMTSAAEPIDALFPRDQAILRRSIQVLPRRPRKVLPVWALRISVVLLSRHLKSFPAAQSVQQGLLSLSCVSRPLCRRSGTCSWWLRCVRKGHPGMAAGIGPGKLAHATRQRGEQVTWDQCSGSYLKESWSLVR
jgi:hypothetical protein